MLSEGQIWLLSVSRPSLAECDYCARNDASNDEDGYTDWHPAANGITHPTHDLDERASASLAADSLIVKASFPMRLRA